MMMLCPRRRRAKRRQNLGTGHSFTSGVQISTLYSSAVSTDSTAAVLPFFLFSMITGAGPYFSSCFCLCDFCRLICAQAPFAPCVEGVETPGPPLPAASALTRVGFRRAAGPGRRGPAHTAVAGSVVPVDSPAGRASGAGSGRGGDPWGRTTGFRPFFDLEEIFRITGGTRSIRCGAGVTADRCVRSPGGM